MVNTAIIAVAFLLALYLAFSKRLASSAPWKATVTPLASIMGSGFLVSAPLLAGIVGNLAVVFMAILLALAYAVGSAIRFNIRYFEPIENTETGLVRRISLLSRMLRERISFEARQLVRTCHKTASDVAKPRDLS